jgi:bifunctional non-homologous end joining protein LigD
MPDLVPPMQVAAGTGQAPVGPDWVVELAWTGHRCVAYVEPGQRTRLLSSGNVSMTPAYPELVPELERRSPPRGMILDGTLVARGEEHAPRVARLQRRSARFRPTERHIRTVPVDLQVADLLWLDGHSLVDLPYRDRRTLLEGLGFAAAPVWTTSPMPISELPSLLRIAEAKGVEALHARHLGSRYRPGQRSPLWVRVPVPRIGRVLVGGWTPVDPNRPDRIASLLVGVPEGRGLRYVGRVGVSGEERRPVAGLRQLRLLDSPFQDGVPADVARDAIWVDPRVVGLVDYTGFTADGRLRLPQWRGTAGAGSPAIPWARRADPPEVPAASSAPAAHAKGAAAAGDTASAVGEGVVEGFAAESADVPPPGGAATDAVRPGGVTAVVETAGPGGQAAAAAASDGAGTAVAGAAAGAAASADAAGGTGADASTPHVAVAPSDPTAGHAAPGHEAARHEAAGYDAARYDAARYDAAGHAAAGHAASGDQAADDQAVDDLAAGEQAAEPVEARRLEQHFVYNSLNAIASLIRTDPARARELLVGFADLSRATDRPTDAPSTLAHELATVRDYLALEQARFGRRLRVEIDVDTALLAAPVEPLRLLAIVRDAVQRDIEPRAQGGVLSVIARPADDGCVVTVTGGAGEPRLLTLTTHVTV